jgi:hypothetical protein
MLPQGNKKVPQALLPAGPALRVLMFPVTGFSPVMSHCALHPASPGGHAESTFLQLIFQAAWERAFRI